MIREKVIIKNQYLKDHPQDNMMDMGDHQQDHHADEVEDAAVDVEEADGHPDDELCKKEI